MSSPLTCMHSLGSYSAIRLHHHSFSVKYTSVKYLDSNLLMLLAHSALISPFTIFHTAKSGHGGALGFLESNQGQVRQGILLVWVSGGYIYVACSHIYVEFNYCDSSCPWNGFQEFPSCPCIDSVGIALLKPGAGGLIIWWVSPTITAMGMCECQEKRHAQI